MMQLDYGEPKWVAPDRNVSFGGIGRALGELWRPFLWVLIPTLLASLILLWNAIVVGVVGFDFVGTIWEPARAVLDGRSPYPPPTREAVELGNPAVYPPFVALVTAPIGLLSLPVAKVVWVIVLLLSVLSTLWILRVRDWRCYILAATSLPVLQGLFWGNITLLLLVPVALAWRYRDHARIAGTAVGVAVAAKLFVWPLVVWFVLTRRYRAAAWAAGSATVLVLGSWAGIGFAGLRDYPALLRVLEDVYAIRSYSIATIAVAFGAPQTFGVVLGLTLGVALLVLAALVARRVDGHAAAFGLAVVACIVAAPIMWPYYTALLFVPVAIVWPRLLPAWFFGHVLLFAMMLPAYSLPKLEPCCRPSDVPRWVWVVSQTFPEPWQAIGIAGILAIVVAGLLGAGRVMTTGTRVSRAPLSDTHAG
jgi:hypothetical protein